jgi:hypothetical protein
MVTGISNHRFDRRKDWFWRSCKDKLGTFEIRKIAINRDLGTKLEISLFVIRGSRNQPTRVAWRGV